MGFHKTIHAGDRVAVWSVNGSVQIVDGPKRIRTFWKRVEPLQKYYADHTEYLEVTEKTGAVHIMAGPAALFHDPILHERIRVKKAVLVDGSEALVVYKGGGADMPGARTAKAESSTAVVRRVVRGPARFIPSADEWIHEFEWSGRPQDGSKTTLQPKAHRFTHLPVVSSSVYHNVNEVRTNDDTLITVKLMLFFELRDVEKMLDATADPIGDFVNAASADVVAFCSTLNYETFLNETHRLNQLATFEQLVSRARHIGYEMSKVVFRGFQAGDKLQSMHDHAIQERTRLRLLEETQVQSQRAADLELHAKQRRAAQQAELAAAEAEERAQLSMVSMKAQLAEQQMADEAAIAKAARQHEATLAQERAARESELAHERQAIELLKARNEAQLSMMKAMHEMGVELTKVLVSQHAHPDKVLKIEHAGGGGAMQGKKDEEGGKGVGGLLGALQLQL